MSTISRLFGRDTRFYELLQQSAAEAHASASTLARLVPQLGATSTETLLGDLAQHRRKHKNFSKETTELLTRVFNTPFEREDVEALSSCLYKITKNVEKIAERLTICPPGADFATVAKQIAMLEEAAGVVETLVNALCAGKHGETVKDDYERIQAIETDADKLMNDCLRDLYHGTQDARLVVFWKDVYELVEKAIDRCRDAGNAVFITVLKNS